MEHRGKAPQLIQDFLVSVKGKGLGVSVLLDKDLQFTPSETSPASPEQPSIESSKKSLRKWLALSNHYMSHLIKYERLKETLENKLYLQCGSRLDVLHMLPSTPPDSLVKTLLYPRQISSSAIEWGSKNESTALNEYTKCYKLLGNTNMIVCRAGFVVCEENPFLGDLLMPMYMTLNQAINTDWQR